ncbi:MAG: hypothetical protein PHP75_04610, partial [Methylacidiphilaceae bacterium]|nr:hypothetical protein [Candidatus Methylacidiphilaceae bacterium]
LLGRRIGHGKEPILPHRMVLCMVGAAMLWIGWYGFNAGSAGAADGIAANAFTTTTLATAVASFVWGMLEYALKGKPSVLGYSTGAVAGLVCITPACGFVDSTGAVLIGVLAAVVPYWACSKLKKTLGYDDALDAFGVHGVGGTLGALLTGVFATAKVNGNLSNEAVAGKNGLAALVSHHTLYLAQLEAIAITIGLAVSMTVALAMLVRLFVTLRVPAEVETQGLDTTQHGEEGYAV